MADNRDYDFVIFGATGFTGKFVVEEVRRIAKEESLTWAVAGRNREKLSDLVSDQSGHDDFVADIIIADINDYQSLLLMCKQAKVVLDCVGPYRFFGEPVVRACVEAEANFVDICGEPQFLENMQLKYNEGAEKGGIYIVGACGFDSIPSDMGVLFAKQKFQGTLNGLNGFLQMKSGPAGGGLHFGTYESAVYGLSDVKTLRNVRKAFGHKQLPYVGARLKSKGAVHFNSMLDSYAIPFLGADASVVKRSQRHLHENLSEPPIQYNMYSCINGLWNLFLFAFFGSIFKFLATRSWGRSLLLKHPKFFTAGLCTHEGPTKVQLEQGSFSITMYGEGYSDGGDTVGREDKPDKKIVIRVSGPEAGYVATPIMMVQAALAIIKERNNLPQLGGVYSPGAAFSKTNLISNLEKNGMKFEVIDA